MVSREEVAGVYNDYRKMMEGEANHDHQIVIDSNSVYRLERVIDKDGDDEYFEQMLEKT